MATKTKAVAVQASEEILAQIGSSYAQEEGGKGIFLPRIGLVSQDITEESGTGRNKKVTVVTPAGEFYIDQQTEEVGADGKKIWSKEEIGDSFDGIIFYKRYQLRMYDETTEEYTSSPIYDSHDEVIPLFCNKKEVARGTPKELRDKYMFTGKDGKTRSALEENRILYVLKDGIAYQMNLRGSSMYSLLSYERGINPTTVVTHFGSEAQEKGDISWNKMTFKNVRKLNQDEAELVIEKQTATVEAIMASKASYAKRSADEAEADKALNELSEDSKEESRKALKNF
jgi:hypothetical protein